TEAETEIETEPQTEEETEIETEPGELAASGADYTVTVSYTAEAEIPENAELLVEEIGQGSEAFCAELEKTNAALQEQSGSYVCRARFFDITIIDADGNEIEPKAAVNVQILLGDEAQMKENLTVTHTDAQGTSLVQAAETSEANGEVAVVFEAEGFSTYGISQTTQNEPAEIAVGESVELQGTAATYHSWSSADTGIVTVSGTGDVGTALGAAASETVIRITHGYGKNKNNIEAEYFYIRVVDDGTLINSNTGYTVTVKGNKKILADAELIVEEIAPESGENSGYYSQMVSDIDSGLSTDVGERDSVFDFLRMYHIYLSKDGGATEYDPSAEEAAQNININLQVTITYDSAPEGWPSQNGSLYVGHYKKNASGEIENKGFADADGVKQIKISGNSITFHIQGFSVIMAGALSSPGSTSSGTQEGVDLSFSTGSLSAADIEEYNSSGANLWAVSSVGAYQSVNGTRIVKYVEPTNIEDVFKVTVAVERNIEDADLQKILEAMPAFILNENKNNVDSPVGTVLEPKEEQNGDCYGSSDESKALDQNDYFYVHYQYSFTENGKTVIKDLANIKMYRASGSSNGQNHGIVGILPDGKWIVIDTTNFKWNGHGTHDVSLSQAQYEALVDAATPTVDVTGVTDYLDTDRFIYLGTAAENTKTKGTDSPTVFLSGTTATVPDENGKITWSGNGWSSLEATDTASMSYYVRLKTSTLDGAASDINAMKFGASGPIAGTGTAYGLSDKKTTASVVAQQAVIENNTISQKQTKCTIETTQPSVKGLLYYINVEKLEKDSSPAKHLEGAAFALYSGKGTTGTPAAVITTDETGFGISAPGLPWGTYTLVETKAPEGYRLPDNPVIGTYTLAYTGDRTAGGNGAGTAEVVDSDKPGKNLIGSSAVTNEPIQDIPVTLVKLGMDSVDTDISEASCLGGAVFELYKVTEDEENKEKYEDISEAKLLSASDADSGVFSARDMRLESGTYVLRESKAPEGYYRIINDLSFKVDAGAEDPRAVIIATGSASNIAISYKTDSSGGETAYTVKVINRSGVELPETGGIGTLPYTSGGAGLILLSCLMYGYSLRRKRERRSD
ncbi:MAG: prealbumin-like fold domain-containing protein, partial [Lachnospiraceae bacterium]|nr:prealbumin-like fold domain-containing protein [Lachnospiraceae bacterium]